MYLVVMRRGKEVIALELKTLSQADWNLCDSNVNTTFPCTVVFQDYELS